MSVPCRSGPAEVARGRTAPRSGGARPWGLGRCILCKAYLGSGGLTAVFGAADVASVTSDCRPCAYRPAIWICPRCGHLQNRVDRRYRELVRGIYANYSPYMIAEGREQVVFAGGVKAPKPRSAAILEKVCQEDRLCDEGKLLDVGCGNGAFLRAFGTRFPDWTLFGCEPHLRDSSEILRIPGLRGLVQDLARPIEEKFDFISLIHVLEHVLEPMPLLLRLRELLKPDGRLLIQVPNILENPFDVVVADHCSHFSLDVLEAFATAAGFEVVVRSTSYVGREITLLLRQRRDDPQTKDMEPVGSTFARTPSVASCLRWLDLITNDLVRESRKGKLGIFGTGIAGTWAAGIAGEHATHFVDEDTLKIGKRHLDRPVLHPDSLVRGDRVYLAFPRRLAISIRERLRSSRGVTYLIPPGEAEPLFEPASSLERNT